MKQFKAERYFSLREVKATFFPSRSERWIVNLAKTGGFGDVVRDTGGWLIPESGVIAYLDRHRVALKPKGERTDNNPNLVQFRHE